MSLLILIILFILLLAGSAFFSGAETALFSLSRARLLAWKGEKSKSRNHAADLMGDGYNRTLIVLIMGNMFMNATLAMTNDKIISRLGLGGLTETFLSIFIATVFLLVLGEMTPKSIALIFPEKTSEIVSGIVIFLRTILHPVILVLERVFALILDLLGRKESQPLSNEEYTSYLDMAQSVGAFSGEETELISNALIMHDRDVTSVMTCRVDVTTVKSTYSIDDISKLIRETRELFYPVIEDDIDDSTRLLAARDFFLLSGDERSDWLKKATIPAIFLPENASMTQTIRFMRERRTPVTLVTDEYGGITGMVRAKEIHEELVGEMSTEFESDEERIMEAGPNSWVVVGTLSLEELEETTGVDFNDSAASTVNGFFGERLGRIPEKNDVVEFRGLNMTPLEVTDNRIVSVAVEKLKVGKVEDEKVESLKVKPALPKILNDEVHKE